MTSLPERRFAIAQELAKMLAELAVAGVESASVRMGREGEYLRGEIRVGMIRVYREYGGNGYDGPPGETTFLAGNPDQIVRLVGE